jgi:uncharacterized protein (TIGR02996 family)
MTTLEQGTGEALLADIIAHPEDNGLRLIYADWLEDNGDVKEAERVRWFVANPKYRQAAAIQYAIPGWPEEDRFRGTPCCVINRGFVSEVRLPLAAWRQHGPALVRQHPLTRVELSCRVVNTAADQPGWLEAPLSCLDGRGGLRPGTAEHWLPGWLIPHEWEAKYRSRRSNQAYYAFGTPQAAIDALSAACLIWARNHASA